MVARVLAFVPPIVAYVMLAPVSFGKSLSVQLSTSQLIALTSGLIVSYFYARMWTDARRNPHMAMALGYYGDLEDEETAKAKQDDEEEDEAEEEDEDTAAAESKDDDASEPRVAAASGKKKGLKAKSKVKKKPVEKKPAEDEDEDEDDESPVGDPATGT
jgi:hypothetical protein